MTREMVLLNRYGMHVRPAGLFAKVASRFKADVKVEKDGDGNVVSGKSIMALMTLEAVCGTKLVVVECIQKSFFCKAIDCRFNGFY